ncbi:hypothetical protein [Streptomyces fagopyri]|uniref:hypothetical protein n=1 Tax=Streptomyces fagopyri TaxID=2662397 RepID=UPI0033F30142
MRELYQRLRRLERKRQGRDSGPTAAVMDARSVDDAETAAAHHARTAYPSALGQAVDTGAWHGYPPVYDNGSRRWKASAVAWLDGGVWLHHSLRISEDDGATDVLTLVAPCTCGRGYIWPHRTGGPPGTLRQPVPPLRLPGVLNAPARPSRSRST